MQGRQQLDNKHSPIIAMNQFPVRLVDLNRPKSDKKDAFNIFNRSLIDPTKNPNSEEFNNLRFPAHTRKLGLEIEIRNLIPPLEDEAYEPENNNYLDLLASQRAGELLSEEHRFYLIEKYTIAMKDARREEVRQIKMANDMKSAELNEWNLRQYFEGIANDIETLDRVGSRVGILILTLNSAVYAVTQSLIDANESTATTSTILNVTTSIASNAMPLLLSAIALEGLSDSIKALSDENADARGFSIFEGLLKTQLASVGFASAIGILNAPLPFLFLGIVLAGVAKSQVVINEVREKGALLAEEINNDKIRLYEKINGLKPIDVSENFDVNVLALNIAENEKKLQILREKEKSAVYSRDRLLVFGLISIGLLATAMLFPLTSIPAVVLTAIGMAIFLGINRHLHHHGSEVAKKIERLEKAPVNPKLVIENIQYNNFVSLKCEAPKTQGLFDNPSAFFLSPYRRFQKWIAGKSAEAESKAASNLLADNGYGSILKY